MKKLIVFIIVLNTMMVSGQKSKLIINDEAVTGLLEWFDNLDKSIVSKIACYPASQLMKEIYMKNEDKEVPSFEKVLESFNPIDSLSGLSYGLGKAYFNREDIKVLFNGLNTIDFDSCFRKSREFFPKDVVFFNEYKVFLVLTGWKWGDAMKIKYVEENGKYALSGDGQSSMMFNLTIINELYGKTLDEKLDSFSEVFVHELFHSMFSDYINQNWPKITKMDAGSYLKYLMLNEGIAHYIGMRNLLKDNYRTKYFEKEKEAFETLQYKYKNIFKSAHRDAEKKGIIAKGTFGEFWAKYVCITGMFMAFHIEDKYGIEALHDCVENGYDYFINKYRMVSSANDNIPDLPKGL